MYIYIHLCKYINPHDGQLDETVETHQIDLEAYAIKLLSLKYIT